MKKEKTIRTYQRRTKTGKVVTVKQHTAKYDAAEALKEAAKKKGAGDELEASKKKGELDLAKIDAYKGDPNELSEKEQQAWQILTGNYPESAEKKLRKMKSLEKVWAYVDAKGKKKSSAKAPKETKSSNSGIGFTADEYKAWYHWDQDADPKNAAAKKVEKALKAKMGAKGYKKYFDEMTDSYSSRGHNKAFKALDSSSSKETKALEQRSKDIAKMVEGQKAQMKKAGIDPDKRLSGKKATEAKKDLVSKGFTQKKDEYGDTYLMKGKDVYRYIPSGVVMGGAKLDKITGGKDFEKAKKLFGEKSVTPSKETKVDSSEYGKAPKHLGMTQQEWNDWMDGGAGYKAADKKAKAHLEKLYGKEGAKAIRKKYEGDGSNKYIDLVSKATADKKVLSEIGDAKRARASIEGLKDPKRDAAQREMKRKDHEYLKGVAKKAMFKNDPWFKRNGWTKQEKRNGNYSWISPDGNVSVPVTKLGMGAGKNFGTPKIKRSKE